VAATGDTVVKKEEVVTETVIKEDNLIDCYQGRRFD
jgi:hypothetical protein